MAYPRTCWLCSCTKVSSSTSRDWTWKWCATATTPWSACKGEANGQAIAKLVLFLQKRYYGPTEMWKVMNALTSRHSRRQEPKPTIDELSTAFGDVVTDDSRAHMLTCPQGPVLKTSFFKLKEVSVDDVLTCIYAVDPHKAVGSDQVSGVLLKSCSTVLAGPLDKIVNGSLSAGYVPRALKLSHISPLFKSGDVSEPKTLDPCPCYPLCRGS